MGVPIKWPFKQRSRLLACSLNSPCDCWLAGWLAGWVSAPSMHTSGVQGLSFLDLSTCTGITHVHVDLASYSTCMCLFKRPTTRESPIYVHIDLHRSNSSFHNLLFILPDSSIGTGTGTRDVLSSPSFSSSLVALNMSTS